MTSTVEEADELRGRYFASGSPSFLHVEPRQDFASQSVALRSVCLTPQDTAGDLVNTPRVALTLANAFDDSRYHIW
ncbi:hypothetical protein OFC55_32665, partial [Escherichia coli]|nr:hypothetical protein [Escherichia coli]